ncbi:exodeoxyribonuclease VII large subunit [Fundicoccus culcitae]|uniref:Exodeoxyribonuclease 7 large subunit n=1 Tax=Fundicoccus culcitae TaxID=2969821 RepID=A0ABY5P6A4_9LACT|nr:exodeoxyribonuclease VII large subunit [Fundicoccus culcitae]UUX34251.1 exodeoxyribonuclease VII large subunit [Fundicoccus culcitae]
MEKESQTTYLTVTALTQYIKRKFDVDPYMQKVWVVGEISNFRYRPNGHQYFSLKDENARIRAMVFSSTFNKIPFEVKDGMKVLVTGRISLYERNGDYQIYVDGIEPDGVGALYQALEQLKEAFAKQGLFDKLQRKIPLYPKKIAVITSPSGSVIQDIITTIKRRYPIVGITVFPTKVQGKEAVDEIVQAFNLFDDVADEYDTLILARGGGSIEDLWCFNDKEVAQAILNCKVPVISSIGHETDTTIADLVADVRAATPTAAAELAVPMLIDVVSKVNQQHDRLFYAINQIIKQMKKQVERFSESYVLSQPERLYQAYSQRLDIAQSQLIHLTQQLLNRKDQQLLFYNQRLNLVHPSKKLLDSKKVVNQLDVQLMRAINQNILWFQRQLSEQINLLDAYSPLKIMARGYSVVEQDQMVVKSIKQLSLDRPINISLVDGKLEAEILSVTELKKEKGPKDE